MVVRSLAELLRDAIRRAGLSQREIARRLDMNSTLLSKVLRDQRTLNPESIDPLCAVLQVPDHEREEIRVAALLRHCPPHIRELVRLLQVEVNELRARLIALEAKPIRRVAETPVLDEPRPPKTPKR